MPSTGENYLLSLDALRRRFDRAAYARLGSSAEAAWERIVVPAYELLGSDCARAIVDGWSSASESSEKKSSEPSSKT